MILIRRKRACVGSALVLLLPGCTLVPRYERPAAPVPAVFPGPAAPASAAAGAAALPWRTVFTEDRLRRLVEVALANNRDLRVALLNVEQARAQYRVTRSASFPQVAGTAGLTRQRSALGTASEWSATVGATAYEVDLFGRVRSLNAQALETYLATAEGARNAQVTLVAQVAKQYFSLRESEEQVALAERTLAAVTESYRLNRARFDAGESNELDVRTAEGQVQTARINLINYELLRAQAMNGLVLLLGGPVPADLPPPRPFDDPGLLAEIPAGLPSDLVLGRPDILESEHTLKAAHANIGAARAAFLPRIALTGSLGGASTELAGLLGSGSGTWTFAPQVTLPLFTGGLNRANLEAAKAGERIAVATYEKAIQAAFREVADALAANELHARHIEVAGAAILAQQRRVELAGLRYAQGEDLYLNVLSAQGDLYTAEQDRLQALFNRLSSEISLYQALGGGWQ